jgi:hypothetical protein
MRWQLSHELLTGVYTVTISLWFSPETVTGVTISANATTTLNIASIQRLATWFLARCATR